MSTEPTTPTNAANGENEESFDHPGAPSTSQGGMMAGLPVHVLSKAEVSLLTSTGYVIGLHAGEPEDMEYNGFRASVAKADGSPVNAYEVLGILYVAARHARSEARKAVLASGGGVHPLKGKGKNKGKKEE